MRKTPLLLVGIVLCACTVAVVEARAQDTPRALVVPGKDVFAIEDSIFLNLRVFEPLPPVDTYSVIVGPDGYVVTVTGRFPDGLETGDTKLFSWAARPDRLLGRYALITQAFPLGTHAETDLLFQIGTSFVVVGVGGEVTEGVPPPQPPFVAKVVEGDFERSLNAVALRGAFPWPTLDPVVIIGQGFVVPAKSIFRCCPSALVINLVSGIRAQFTPGRYDITVFDPRSGNSNTLRDAFEVPLRQ